MSICITYYFFTKNLGRDGVVVQIRQDIRLKEHFFKNLYLSLFKECSNLGDPKPTHVLLPLDQLFEVICVTFSYYPLHIDD